MDTRLLYTLLVGLIALERLFELRLSAKNAAWAKTDCRPWCERIEGLPCSRAS